MKPNKRSLTNKLDKECSRIVRSLGKCQRCSKTESSLLQCCHIFSRANRATRWSFPNLLCLCAGCHFWGHQNPILFTEFVKEIYGEAGYERLKENAAKVKKWTLNEMQELLESLRKI